MGYVGQHELMQSAHLVLIGYLEVLASLAQVRGQLPQLIAVSSRYAPLGCEVGGVLVGGGL